MAKTIRFTFDDTEYVLQFTRRTAKEMEDGGFRIAEVTDRPMTLLPMLFKGAFLANHRGIKNSKVNYIYAAMTNKEDLMAALIGLYEETMNTLLDEPEEGNPNVSWTLS